MDPTLASLDFWQTLKHKRLSGPRQIRLLKIKSEDGHNLRLPELVVCNLDTAPKYEAISYTWGDTTNLRRLELSTHEEIAVSKSLYKALPWIKFHAKQQYVWADQICIDQSHVEERNQQVRLMGELFAKAQRVLAWLGVEDRDARLLLAVLECIGSEPEGACIQFTVSAAGDHDHNASKFLKRIKNDAVTQRQGNMQSTKSYFEALERCLSCKPWFRRAWVVQEVVLAKEVDFVLSSTKLAFRDFARVAGTLTRAQWLCMKGMFETDWSVDALNLLNCIWKLRHVGPEERMRAYWPLQFFADSAGQCELSEPRDRIYAFVGMFPSARVPFTIDYSLPIHVVYIAATRTMLSRSRNLEVLARAQKCFINLSKWSSLRDLIPSWVPDYSLTYDLSNSLIPLWTTEYPANFCASLGRHYLASDCSSPTSLYSQGRIVGTITFRLCHPLIESHDNWSVDRVVEYMDLDWYYNQLKTRYQRVGGMKKLSRRRVLNLLEAGGARYIHADPYKELIPQDWQKILTVNLQKYDTWIAAQKDCSDISKPDVQVERSLDVFDTDVVWRRQIVGTSLGTLGLASKHVEIGDKIAILHGSAVPIILREKKRSTTGGPGECNESSNASPVYESYGQAYIEDIMRGEIVNWKVDEADTIEIV